MMRAFNPPLFTQSPVKHDYPSWRDWFFGNFMRVFKYSLDWNTDLATQFNTLLDGYGADIASAATINITSMIHRVTGSITVQTINQPAGQSATGPLFLYGRDGFATNTAGNISVALTVAAGHCAVLAYHPALALWVGVTS